MAEINANILDFNRKRKEAGSTSEKGSKRRKTAEQVWMFKEITRDEGKEGIDWFLYPKEGLVPKL